MGVNPWWYGSLMPAISPVGAKIVSLPTAMAGGVPRSRSISLEAVLSSRLRLQDPLMVASSHHTDNENSLVELGNLAPSAVTLKTISNRQGGSGAGEPRKREQMRLDYPGGNRLGRFTDGPKKTELWDAPTALSYIQKAKHCLPTTAIGISIAEGENYVTISQSLDLSDISYVELNWKYTFRDKEYSNATSFIKADLENFYHQFGALPILVKIPNEFLPFLQRDEMCEIYEFLHDNDGILLVANTKRAIMPPSRQPNARKLYDRGVIYGEQLFLDTFNAISTLSALRARGVKVPKLVATGGMTDIGAIIDVIGAGAEAVQICSVLDYRKTSAIDVLRRQMRKLIADSGLESYEKFKADLHSTDDGRKKWLSASQRARQIETSHDEIIKFMRLNKEKALKEVEDTLAAETLSDVAKGERSRSKPLGRRRATILINRANIAAFLISQRLAGELNLGNYPVDVPNPVGYVNCA
jgi:dihydroorotate dehydrogenase